MIQKDSLLTSLMISQEKYRSIAVVGGGGKTSLIFRLCKELISTGKKVIVTTTTHMAYEPDRPFAENGNTDKILQNLEFYTYTVTAGLEQKNGKICSFPEEKLSELRELADVLLIEADGAKCLPLKVPGEWEPVIPEFVELVIGVVGLDALGQPINTVCHRPERVADFLGKDINAVVEAEDIAKIAASGNGLKKCAERRAYRVLLNKTDIPGKSEAAEQIAEKLKKTGVYAAWGSLQNEKYGSLCAHATTEKIVLIMLAAGNSCRFGANKLMHEINGMPMYLRTLENLRKAGAEIGNCKIIIVTQYEEIIARAKELGIEVRINPQPERGISSSMQTGLAAAVESDACLFCVADQPWLTSETIVKLVHKFQSEQKGMACTVHGEKTGNPCIFSQKYYQELMEITGDRGGKQIIKKYPEDVAYLFVGDARELQDVDVPDALL